MVSIPAPIKGHLYSLENPMFLTGIFSRRDGVLYGQLQTMREKADYQNVFTLEEEEGRRLIETAEELRKRICTYVSNKIGK